MRFTQQRNRRGKNGVVKIQRATYATVNGTQVNNSWWNLHDKVKTRAKGICETKGCRNIGSEPHHIVPLSRGGTNDPSNLIYLCKSCHDIRHNHLFRRRR